MTFSQFKLAYSGSLIFFKILVYITLIFWIKNSFDYFSKVDFFNYINDLHKLEKNLPVIWDLIKPWLIDSGWVILKITILQSITKIIKHFPVLPKWLNYWDNNGDISTIFGRYITGHFRWNKNINFMTIIHLYNYSKTQVAFLHYHEKNELTSKFLKKYDSNYTVDLIDES